MLVVSWDRRGVAAVRAAGLKCTSYLVIRLKTRDAPERSEENCAATLAELRSQGVPEDAIISSEWMAAEDVDSVFVETSRFIQTHIAPRTLSLFVELSSAPMHVALHLVSLLIGGARCRELTIGYMEGEYPDEVVGGDSSFGYGRRRRVAIPGTVIRTDESQPFPYALSLGFEEARTFQALRDVEPDRLLVLLAEPGFEPKYTSRARAILSELQERFHVEQDDVLTAAAGSVEDAFLVLIRHSRSFPAHSNLRYLAAGTKSHGCAMVLASVARGGGEVLALVPEVFRAVNVKPTGTFWLTRILDSSVWRPSPPALQPEEGQ
ncbi:MAG: hypothetical protein EP330_08540 [Deltaproteobacteria bacterium]|nr:MAG: hypothetical protein EP330_08540 [Deltaproteobacteria bacterium]